MPATAQVKGPLIHIAREPASAHVNARVDGALPPAAAALLDRELRLAVQLSLLADAPAGLRARLGEIQVTVDAPPPSGARPALPVDRIGRFGVTMLLWLTLTGALGMLLQAVVRERSQRALESLMSATRPIEIVGGKLLGVGLVSLIVLAAWLGAGAAVAPLAGGTGGQFAARLLAAAFGDPAQLAWSLLVYVLAFAMYGSALMTVGALARDVASAQNLSRPVFGVLLLVFFAALSQLGGAGALPPALLWAPPVTPFALLLAPPGSLDAGQMLGGVLVMVAGSAMGLTAAARLLIAQMDGAPPRRLRRPATA
jgi:ABC-2 type transport system permease protein